MKSALTQLMKPMLRAAVVALLAQSGTALAQEAPATVSPNNDNGSAASLLGAPENSSRIDEFLKRYKSTSIGTTSPAVSAPATTPDVTAADIPAAENVVAPDAVAASPTVRQPDRPATLMDSQTEARADVAGCVECEAARRNATQRLDVAPAPAPTPAPEPVAGNSRSTQERCFSAAIVAAAKRNVRDRYGNRPASQGVCALGVRTSLNAAGAYTGGGLGNAIDYYSQGRLAELGFKNFIGEFPNPEQAPPGAVLVFSGPNTSTYLRTGYEGTAGNKGDWVGHVTIKGDDGRYYTDARTDEPALYWPSNQTRRKLVGVYLMQQCVRCSSALRQQCGG